MNKLDLVEVRGAIQADKNFILATFLRGLYYGDTWFKEIPKSIFMENYHKIINELIVAPETKIKVACLKDDQETILGYSIVNQDETVLSWVFCKSAWRGIGISKLLMPASIKSVSHLTKAGIGILRKHPNVIFNPFNLGLLGEK
jgi:hypothetical protein